MNPILKNILAVITGLVVGSLANGGLIELSGHIIPPPEGANITTMEGIKASMHLMQPKHFIFPFLAHAFGTFVGAFIAAYIAANNKMKFAMAIGFVFLLGGIIMVMQLPSPVWFSILDLAGAYLPMAYFAGKLATRNI